VESSNWPTALLHAAVNALRGGGTQRRFAIVPVEDLRFETDHPEQADRKPGLARQLFDHARQPPVAHEFRLGCRAKQRRARGQHVGACGHIFVKQPEFNQAGEEFRRARLRAIIAADDVHHRRGRMIGVEIIQHFDHAFRNFRLVRAAGLHRISPGVF